MERLYADIQKKNEGALASLKKEFSAIRTGRASLSLLEGITVNYYGTPTPLNQVATLAVPEPRLMVVQPWNTSLLKEIERAILKSDLGLTPVNDGKVIRIPIPPLSEERRKELVKIVKRMAEEGKVAIRNIRREGVDQLRKLEKEGKLSQDDLFKDQEEVQKITDKFIEKVDQLLAGKEKDILEV